MKRKLIRAWYRIIYAAPRCECGWRIWPWQKRAYDPELMMAIHASCGTPDPDWEDTTL